MKKNVKVLSGALAASLTMGAMPVFAADMSADELYKAAFEAVLAAQKARTQESINAARTAIKALAGTDAEFAVGEFSKQVDGVQQELFEGFLAALDKAQESNKQADINAARTYVEMFRTCPDTLVYVEGGWSQEVDLVQQKLIDKAEAAVRKAQGTRLQADVDAAKALLEELAISTNKDVTAWVTAIETELEAVKVIDLKVTKVNDINANYVTVAITAPEEDMLAQTVEVKNGEGTVVAVKALDIAAGDKTAEFEFVTAVKATDLKGVWTVNGQAYDLDLFNNLSAFLNAQDQLELNKALTDLGIKNVKVENMPEYKEAQEAITKTAEELTVEDVQKLVDAVNTKAISAEDEAAIVKAVVDADKAGNQVALLKALQNPAFVRVNPEWVSEATNGYMAKIVGTETKIADIQAVINGSNDTILNAVGTLTTTGIDRAKLTESKALIEAWATVDKDGKITDPTIKTIVDNKAIEIQLAVADVVGATTPTSLKSRLASLAVLVNDPAKLDMKNYVDANGKAYITAIKTANTVTVDEIKIALTTVNEANANTALNNVNSADTADKLLVALKALGLTDVIDANKDVYFVTDNANFAAVSDKDAAQKQVKAINDAIAFKEAHKVALGLKSETVKVSDLPTLREAVNAYGKLTIEAKTFVTEGTTLNNLYSQVQGSFVVDVNLINGNGNMSEKLELLGNRYYEKLSDIEKQEVSMILIATRPDTGFTSFDNVEKVLNNSMAKYKTSIAAINSAKTVVEMEAALKSTGLVTEEGSELTLLATAVFEARPEAGYATFAEILEAVK